MRSVFSQHSRKPLELRRQAFLEADARRKSKILTRERRVGIRVPHVALLRLVPRDVQLTTGDSSNHLEYLIHRDARAATNIVHTARYASGGCSNRRADCVVDVRKVARLLAVAKETHRLLPKCCAEKPMEAHIRPLTRSINGEVPQRHGRDTVICVIEITKLFSRELRHAV